MPIAFIRATLPSRLAKLAEAFLTVMCSNVIKRFVSFTARLHMSCVRVHVLGVSELMPPVVHCQFSIACALLACFQTEAQDICNAVKSVFELISNR